MESTGQTQPGPGLGQCVITGLWFPEDELVNIEGHLVSAEGKPALLDKLKRGEPIGNEMERSSVGQRFGASFVDGLIFRVATFVLAMIFVTQATSTTGASGAEVTVDILVYLMFIAYLAAMHGIKGQTVGKMAAKIKVVKSDGGPVSIQIAAVRAFVYMGPLLLGMIIMAMGLLIPGIIVMVIGGLLNLASIIMALADGSQQRALHDRIAGTRVIRVRQ